MSQGRRDASNNDRPCTADWQRQLRALVQTDLDKLAELKSGDAKEHPPKRLLDLEALFFASPDKALDRLADNLASILENPTCRSVATLAHIIPFLCDRLTSADYGGRGWDVFEVLVTSSAVRKAKLQQATFQSIVNALEALHAQRDAKQVSVARLLSSTLGLKLSGDAAVQAVHLASQLAPLYAIEPLTVALATGAALEAVEQLTAVWMALLPNQRPSSLTHAHDSDVDVAGAAPLQAVRGLQRLPTSMKWLDRLSVNWADYVDFLSLILVSYRLHKSSTREEVLRILREMEQRRESSRYDVRGWLQRNWAPDSPGFERVLEDIDSLDDRTRVQRAIADSFGIGNSRFLERARNLVVDQCLDGACGDGPWLIAAMRSHWGDVTSQSDARLSAALRQSFVDHLAQRWKHTLLEPSAETSSELSQALEDLLGILTRHADAALRSQREAAATELRSMEQAYQTDLRDAEQRYENVRSLLDEERQREPAPEGAGRDRQIVDAVVRFADDLDNLARAQSADQRLVAYILRKLDALLLAVSVERIGQLHQCLTGDQVDPTKYRSASGTVELGSRYRVERPGYCSMDSQGRVNLIRACEIVQVRAVESPGL